MRLTTEDSFAEMMKKVNRRLDNVESNQDVSENPVIIREVTETESSSDTTEQSVNTDPGWTWGSSSWGYDIWQ